jgi:hypothetical protein
MQISPKYYSSDWIDLKLTEHFSDNWHKGADIIYDRIHGRYLAQIEVLEEHLDSAIWLYSGFLIMAIDCMVIETLNQFYLGLEDTNQKYRRKNWESFRDFFLRSDFFKNDFDDDKARIFYDHIRNGLLHQAQTKEKSLINIKFPSMITLVNSSNLDDGIIVNRNLFHKALLQEFEQYISALQTDDEIFDDLRQKCVDKMEIIC